MLAKKRRTLAGFMALALGLIVLSAYSLFHSEFRGLEGRFSENVRNVTAAVRNQLDTNEAVIAGFAAFLQAVDQGDTEAAARYAEVALRGYPHIYMMEVARAVPAAEERRFEALLRRTWHADFELKSFPGVAPQLSSSPAIVTETWPILFMYPMLPQASAIYGVRLETVPYLSDALAKSHASPNAVASPVFSMYEGGNAYIVLQWVSRSDEKVHGSLPNFFGSTMVALLLVKTDALLSAIEHGSGDPLLSIYAALKTTTESLSPVVSVQSQPAGWLDRLIMPKLTREVEIDSLSQPMKMHYERQLRFSDVLSMGNLSILAGLLIGLITVPVALVRHFAAIESAEIEHARAAFLASHDVLTRLPNRYLLADRFEQALDRLKTHETPFAVFVIDLDHFKKINDQHGHVVGDQVLHAVAARMVKAMRNSDTVARYGGDEFVVLVADIADSSTANLRANNVLEAVQQPISTSVGLLSLSCSIGVSLCPAHGQDLDTLLKAADDAMYDVKQEGKNGLAVSGDERR
ncbi:sensor domain-containing diguanylate cyclase [Pseudomonas huanghezhanensis]|uniref:sensor domain-containing diguanylate cyclase n=1 Tax=Pseudomonas huanghezhanensis TaxID=3002903 RepID=UPI0022866958|nr:sensor domain-containing diguanylate cyclase [Pseudomonas sp. BSw22131]